MLLPHALPVVRWRDALHTRAASLGQCCGRWIEQDEATPVAETLMRSRYEAFAIGQPLLKAPEPASKWRGTFFCRAPATQNGGFRGAVQKMGKKPGCQMEKPYSSMS
jgi:hypothetical protein